MESRPILRLARDALNHERGKLLLLDSVHRVCLYYPWDSMAASPPPRSDDPLPLPPHTTPHVGGGDNSDARSRSMPAKNFPFPPPDDCTLVEELRMRRCRSRFVAPLTVCRAGTTDARYFDDGLLEDHHLPEFLGGHSYPEFLSAVAVEVEAELAAT
uniref:Uncharacterized protein n=2 Tax=Octactis speculum TaxID=3111310 RepID=A0A7S2D3A3_9STRA|mmetsp:Transcript_42876/g.58540  ORF Transcript_42876/g.58540 Transcript_42876/m.58540 type:complete len:157 (+) Transcript_42876:718-1188(+)